jgi:small subunit ribosomal protein S21
MTKAHEKRSPSEGGGLIVSVRNNDVEKAIRLLKKKINVEGLQKDLRKKEYYEKPSEKRRRRHAEAVNRWRKLAKQIREEW